jgi:DNA polymerase III subunit tau, C-terminal domain
MQAVSSEQSVLPAATVPESGGQAASGQDSSPASQPAGTSSEQLATGSTRSDYLGSWPDIVKAARAKGPKVEALLRDARPIRWTDVELELGFPYTFHRDQIDQPENRAIVEASIAEVTGNSVRVRCVHATKEEIRALTGSGSADEDDGFVDEVERLLRGVHARKLKTSSRLRE